MSQPQFLLCESSQCAEAEGTTRPSSCRLLPLRGNSTPRHWGSEWGEGSAVEEGLCRWWREAGRDRRCFPSQHVLAVTIHYLERQEHTELSCKSTPIILKLLPDNLLNTGYWECSVCTHSGTFLLICTHWLTHVIWPKRSQCCAYIRVCVCVWLALNQGQASKTSVKLNKWSIQL